MRAPWPYVVVAAAIFVFTAAGADVSEETEPAVDGATTESSFLPKKDSATWDQDDEKEGELEGELHLLGQADPTDPYDPLEELDDTDQQRDRPTDDEDDEGSEVTVTTLVPTATTEEDTRVDEPTDRGPAEPTKENGVTVTMVMEQSAPSATLSPDRISEQANETGSSAAVASSDETDAQSEEEELEAIKRQMKEDDLIPVPNPMNGEAKQDVAAIADELDQLNDDDSDGDDEKSEEKEPGGEEERSEPEVSPSAISPIGQLGAADSMEELLSRSTRRVQETPHLGQFPAKMNEDVVELMARLSEKPRSWARISNLLGKLDYESSSQLKSALQIQALKDNQATETSTRHSNHNHNNNNMKHAMTAAKLASLPPSSHEQNIASEKEHHHSNHRPYDHHPNERPKIPGKHNKFMNNQVGLKQLTTSNGRYNGGGNMRVPPNTIHVQWEKNRRPPVSQDTLPVHANSRLHYLAHKVAGSQTASSWYQPNRPIAHGVPGKGPVPNTGVKPLVSPHQNPGMKDGSKPRPLGYPYRGPISTLAVDVPGQGMLNNKYPGGEKNNQAFIAVSVYKPKDSYRQVNLSPKMNGLPHRYPSTVRSKGSGNSNFAMEKPVTVVGPPPIEIAPVRSGPKGFKNHKGKGRNKGAKAKQKGKNGILGSQGKSHHARKLKYRNKLATDEIEAQLLALSKMERKLKQHLMQKEKLRQRIRMKHDQRSVRSPRQVASFM